MHAWKIAVKALGQRAYKPMDLKCFCLFLCVVLTSRFLLTWDSVKTTWIIHPQISVERVVKEPAFWDLQLPPCIKVLRGIKCHCLSQSRAGAHKCCSLLLPAIKFMWVEEVGPEPSGNKAAAHLWKDLMTSAVNFQAQRLKCPGPEASLSMSTQLWNTFTVVLTALWSHCQHLEVLLSGESRNSQPGSAVGVLSWEARDPGSSLGPAVCPWEVG